MKRTIELSEELDSTISDLQQVWNQYAGTSYAETVRILLVLGLDTLKRAGKQPLNDGEDVRKAVSEAIGAVSEAINAVSEGIAARWNAKSPGAE